MQLLIQQVIEEARREVMILRIALLDEFVLQPRFVVCCRNFKRVLLSEQDIQQVLPKHMSVRDFPQLTIRLARYNILTREWRAKA